MKKIFRLIAILVTLVGFGVIADAQQTKKVSRIGILFSGSSSAASPPLEPFRQELGKLGYVEGQTIAFEYRFAEGNPDRLPELAAQLVRLKADVIVATAPPEIRAAKQATLTIPIVMAGTPVDPVAAAFVASLARPGRNITGLTSIAGELRGKRLELLKEVSPRISRVALLWPPPQQEQQMKEIETVARALGMQIQSLVVRSLDDLESVFSGISRKLPDGLLVAVSRFILDHRARIIDFSTNRRLPAMYDESLFVKAGGLMSYAANDAENFRRAAVYVDKILKGAKPADLPVERPTKFEFVINLKTAKQIGVTIPQSVLYRADKVIR